MKIIPHYSVGLLALALLPRLAATAPDRTDEIVARQALREELTTESVWVKVHAAEVLAAYGDAAFVRPVFLEELRLHPEQNQYRVGIHRVLARTAPTPAARAAEVAWIARVFINPKSADRGHAVETLCKLGAPHDAAVVAAARAWLTQANQNDAVFISWLLWEAGDESALRFIVSQLRSPVATVRLRAAYALRLTGTTDPAALAGLARAADTERAEGDPAVRAIVVGAAYQLQAAPGRLAAWRDILEAMVAHGKPIAIFHALQALMPTYRAADVPRLRTLMESSKGDVRIAAAWAILDITTRPPERR